MSREAGNIPLLLYCNVLTGRTDNLQNQSCTHIILYCTYKYYSYHQIKRIKLPFCKTVTEGQSLSVVIIEC